MFIQISGQKIQIYFSIMMQVIIKNLPLLLPNLEHYIEKTKIYILQIKQI